MSALATIAIILMAQSIAFALALVAIYAWAVRETSQERLTRAAYRRLVKLSGNDRPTGPNVS